MRIKRLNWDKRNIFHIACHGITVKDVEDVCADRHIARKVKDRYIIYGDTEAGRHIFIVLEKRGDNFRPITARDMSESEKKIYKKYTKMIATETTEHTEGKYSVLSVYSVAKSYTVYTIKRK
jgi:uncharacterized DUF497 family protein